MTLLKGINVQQPAQNDDFEAGVQRAMQLMQNQNKAPETSQEYSLLDRGAQVLRGAAKTYGGFAESVKDINPVDMAKTAANKILERQGKPLINSDVGIFSGVEKAANTVNEWAGKDLTPTDSTGQMLETFGEFAAPLPIPGGGLINSALWAAPITAGAQILKEMGLDENSSNAWASVLVPLMLSLGRKGIDYGANALHEGYRQESALGEASDFLKEKVGQQNVPKVIENIDNFKNPFPGELGTTNPPYQPNTAEIADNVGLSQYHRAKYGNIPALGEKDKANMEILKESLNSQASTEHSAKMVQDFATQNKQNYELKTLNPKTYEPQIRLGEATQEFESGYKPTIDEAGQTLQNYLHKRTEDIHDSAMKVTESRYRDAKTKALEKPENALKYIEEEIKNYSRVSPINRSLRKAQIAIEHAKVEHSKIDASNRKAREEIIKRYENDPKMAEIALKESKIPEPKNQQFNVGRLHNARKEISSMISAFPENDKEGKMILSKVLENLDKDMETIPEIFDANQIYREIMQPANFIKEHQILGDIVKKDPSSKYLANFTVSPSDIPKRVLNGNKSIDGAKALMDHASGLGTKEHREVISTLKSYINSDILGNIVKENGHVDLTKLDAWKKSNPGAFILYSGLEDKLSNLKNAQKMVDQVISQNKMMLDNYHKKAMEAVLNKDANKIASDILNSKNSVGVMEDTIKLLSKDDTGDALKGLQRAVIDDFMGKFNENLTYTNFNRYMNKNKGALEKLFSKEQIAVMDNVRDMLKRRFLTQNAGRVSGSDTSANLYENAAEKFGSRISKKLIPGIDYFKDIDAGVKNAKNNQKLEFLKEALIEPEFAKKLLEKEQKTGLTFFEALITQKGTTGDWLRQSNWNTVKKGIGTAFINYQKARMADGERD
jgi:hypothetical protein